MIRTNSRRTAEPVVSHREIIRVALLQRIGDGVLPPGTRIIEARLAKEFRVSAIPVREAIRELVSMGVLASENFCGAWVREVSMRETADALEVKAALEAQAARSSACQWRQHGATLRKICKAITQAAVNQDLAAYQRHNHAFHRHIVVATGNATLLKMWEGLAFEVRTRPILEFLTNENPRKIARGHDAIVTALIAGQRTRAARLLATHASDLVDHLRQKMLAEAAPVVGTALRSRHTA